MTRETKTTGSRGVWQFVVLVGVAVLALVGTAATVDAQYAAVQLDAQGHPLYAKLAPVAGFTSQAIADWARVALLPGTNVLSDGLGCFAGVIDAGWAHTYIVVGARKPRELPRFTWVNTLLPNLKTAVNGAHKHFAFGKYARAYLGAFAYRFNHRVHLRSLLTELLFDLARTPPITERDIRQTCAL